MKTLKYFLTAIFSVLVTTFAFAQVDQTNQPDPFEYGVHKCKYKVLKQVNPAEWYKAEDGGMTTDNDNTLLYQVSEKCQDFYIQPGVFVGSRETELKPGLKAELIFGHDFCLKENSNFGLGVELKVGAEKIWKLQDGELSTIKEGYAPIVGGNLQIQFSKHKKTQFSIYGGVGVTYLTSNYIEPEVGIAVKSVKHWTANYEVGAQALWRVKYGRMIGVKAGYSYTSTKDLSQGQMFVGVVFKMKKAYKSKSMSYGAYMDAMDAIQRSNAMRGEAQHKH